MAKNIKFDRQEVINKATDLYWEKGFHGTSMRNLQDVIDMRPGSIYATFGSKEGLYKEALQCYANKGVAELKKCADSDSSPMAALKVFITNSIIGSAESGPSGMCMLVKTVSELTQENIALLNEAKRLLNVMEQAFSSVLVKAQVFGELDKTKDTIALARYIQIQLMGLRTYMQVNNDKEKIKLLIDDIFAKEFIDKK